MTDLDAANNTSISRGHPIPIEHPPAHGGFAVAGDFDDSLLHSVTTTSVAPAIPVPTISSGPGFSALGDFDTSVTVTVVPEPASWILVAAGLTAAALYGYRSFLTRRPSTK